VSSVARQFDSDAHPPVWSVSEFNRHVARLLERQIPLLWIAGEISNLTRAASGHLYFSLKDREAQVRCVMFRNANRLLDFQVKEGDRVEARALAGLYAPRGEFQLTLETLRRAGAGALYEAFLKIKQKLADEGLFDAARKRPLPAFPRSVGIVTSLQAAALRDVLTTLARRAPHLRIVIYPTLVQGSGAPAQLVAAINRASARAAQYGEIDVLMVVRGGGSIEDLWSFNDEQVARAIAASVIPVVSGVGHETDVTIVDFVAHVRAATPTAAAELVSPDAQRIQVVLSQHVDRLRRALLRRVATSEQRLDDVERRLKSPVERLAERERTLVYLARRLSQNSAAAVARSELLLQKTSGALRQRRIDPATVLLRLDRLRDRLKECSIRTLTASLSRFELLLAKLLLLDPQSALKRGYAIVADQNGAIVDDATSLAVHQRVSIRFARGRADAEIVNVEPPSATG
jgi:exodeoxyribonuclease VII large subunit